MNKAALKSG